MIMEPKKLKLLIIDDHPSQIAGYKTILSYNHGGHELDITEAYNSRSAYDIIMAPGAKFDMVFLDRSLPGFPEMGISDGEDLGLLVRKQMPKTKIVMLTSHSETFLLYNIFRKLEPAGLMVKSDFSAQELLDCFEKIVAGGIHYSESVRIGIRELLSREAYLDDINRQIILLLSQGVKTKNMSEHIGLSQSSVEKRKAQIKDYFCIEHGGDEDIVNEARRLGFI